MQLKSIYGIQLGRVVSKGSFKYAFSTIATIIMIPIGEGSTHIHLLKIQILDFDLLLSHTRHYVNLAILSSCIPDYFMAIHHVLLLYSTSTSDKTFQQQHVCLCTIIISCARAFYIYIYIYSYL